MPALFPGRMS